MSNLAALGNYLPGAGSSDGMEEMCGGFHLTRKQRFYGFGICIVVGFLISFLSLFLITVGQIVAFAVLYTAGNIVSLAATGFLVGFVRQLKKMFDSTRLIASIIFIVSMILTIALSVWLKNAVIAIILCIIQYCALFWYSASYIPFARDMLKKCFGSLMK